MAERRPSNSELRLRRLEEEECDAERPRGILELFHREEEQDADAALRRDDESHTE